jgi:hypothetical protein
MYIHAHTNQVDEEWQKHEMDAGKDALTAILVNVTQHEAVPHHRLLTPKEKKV